MRYFLVHSLNNSSSNTKAGSDNIIKSILENGLCSKQYAAELGIKEREIISNNHHSSVYFYVVSEDSFIEKYMGSNIPCVVAKIKEDDVVNDIICREKDYKYGQYKRSRMKLSEYIETIQECKNNKKILLLNYETGRKFIGTWNDCRSGSVGQYFPECTRVCKAVLLEDILLIKNANNEFVHKNGFEGINLANDFISKCQEGIKLS